MLPCLFFQNLIWKSKVGDTFIADSSDIVNEFNDFFVNVASKLKEPVTNTKLN